MENLNYKIGEWVHISGKVSHTEVSGTTLKFDGLIVHKVRVGVVKEDSFNAETKKSSDFVNVIFFENPVIVNPCLKSLKRGRKVVIDGFTCKPIEWSDSLITVCGESIRDASAENKWSEYKDELCSFTASQKESSPFYLGETAISAAYLDDPDTFAPIEITREGYRSLWVPDLPIKFRFK